jgi:adenylosuccinate lyase
VIARYSRPEMARVWNDQAKYERWLEVELAVLEAQEKAGLVPAGSSAAAKKAARFDVARIEALEATLQHDVIAFLTDVNASLGDEKRFVHQGMTSSDLVDTALALQVREAGRILLAGVARVEAALAKLAAAHKTTLMVGRTHGMHAEPMTFGLKALAWSTAVRRSRRGLETALAGMAVGKLSGAVGQGAHLSPALEEACLQGLGLRPEPVATQVVARDRHAALVGAIALLGANYERVATEIRHLQRTEVRELEEPFGAGQKGSSAMPHKRNPIVSERVAGLARLLRAYAGAALEDVALWHERDITHSSVERVALPDAFLLADYVSDRLAFVLEGLRVDAARMRANLDASGGLVFSQRVLLALTAAGASREDAYAAVQRCAMRAWHGEGAFRELLAEDETVAARLGPRLADCFDVAPFLRSLDELYARAARALDAPSESA